MEYGDLIIDSMSTFIAIGFGRIGLFTTHITGDGSIGIPITTMGGTDHITPGIIGLIDLGTLLITKIYGDHLEETVI